MIRTLDDIDYVVRRCAARGVIKSAQIDKVKEKLENIIQGDEVLSWFSADNIIISERPMIKDGSTYRADRIVITKDGKTIVVDYKFGGKTDKKYHKQVLGYMDILRDCGYENIEGRIWYPFENKIETIKE